MPEAPGGGRLGDPLLTGADFPRSRPSVYQDQAPTKDELLELIERAGGDPRPFIRTKEPEAKKLADEDLDDAETVAGFVASHPRVLQRPILVAGDTATIARDPEALQGFLDGL